MGMFDTVRFKCTNCGDDVEEQTKGRIQPRMDTFDVPSELLPVEIAHEMCCYGSRCKKCGKFLTFRIKDLPDLVSVVISHDE